MFKLQISIKRLINNLQCSRAFSGRTQSHPSSSAGLTREMRNDQHANAAYLWKSTYVLICCSVLHVAVCGTLYNVN